MKDFDNTFSLYVAFAVSKNAAIRHGIMVTSLFYFWEISATFLFVMLEHVLEICGLTVGPFYEGCF